MAKPEGPRHSCPHVSNKTLCTAIETQTSIPVAGASGPACDSVYRDLALRFCPYALLTDDARYAILGTVLILSAVGTLASLFVIGLFLFDRAMWKVNHFLTCSLAVVDFFTIVAYWYPRAYVLLAGRITNKDACYYLGYLSESLSIVSCLSAMLIAFHRYVHVCLSRTVYNSLFSVVSTVLFALSAWLVGFLLSIQLDYRYLTLLPGCLFDVHALSAAFRVYVWASIYLAVIGFIIFVYVTLTLRVTRFSRNRLACQKVALAMMIKKKKEEEEETRDEAATDSLSRKSSSVSFSDVSDVSDTATPAETGPGGEPAAVGNNADTKPGKESNVDIEEDEMSLQQDEEESSTSSSSTSSQESSSSSEDLDSNYRPLTAPLPVVISGVKPNQRTSARANTNQSSSTVRRQSELTKEITADVLLETGTQRRPQFVDQLRRGSNLFRRSMSIQVPSVGSLKVTRVTGMVLGFCFCVFVSFLYLVPVVCYLFCFYRGAQVPCFCLAWTHIFRLICAVLNMFAYGFMNKNFRESASRKAAKCCGDRMMRNNSVSKIKSNNDS